MENLNKEKQIEKMAKVIISVPPIEFPIGSRMQGKHIYTATKIAEHLYNASYRKQSEGEWVVEAYKGDEIVIIPYIEHQHDEPFCSLCGKYALLDGGEEYVTSNFCPNCGAKMKGGAE